MWMISRLSLLKRIMNSDFLVNRIMKKNILTILFALLVSGQFAPAQNYEYRLKAGFNIGGTSPLPLPAEIREIKSFTPAMAFAIGGEVIYNLNDRWGVASGLRLETKGMSTHARVKSYKMTMNVSEGDNTGGVSGYFTGDDKTKVSNEYLTIPVTAVYTISPAFEVNAGMFLSIKLSSEFTGEAFDAGDGAYIREENPTGEKIGVTSATYDFSRDIRNFNWGFQVGTHWYAFRQFSLYADFTMAANSIFPKDFETVSFDMYNIYLNVGFAYTF